MKHWQETHEIFERIGALGAGSAALATVVQIAGSAYRRPGARFLITPDGGTLGGVSGGCLEEDVRQTGLGVIESGAPRLLHYETGDDEDALWGLGLGCDGEVDIFVQSTAAPAFAPAAARVRELLAGDDPFAAVTIVDTPVDGPAPGLSLVTTRIARPGPSPAEPLRAAAAALDNDASSYAKIGDTRAFIEVFRPPSRLVVCGAGDDAIPLVRLAASVGFRVIVVDHRPAYLEASRFPAAWQLVRALPDDELDVPIGADSFVVLKTHNLTRDKAWARRFVATSTPYIGLLGPRARCDEIAETAPDAERHRFFGPVGLDLGAEGPEQVGLAVVAELVAVRRGRAAGHLRTRTAAIHV